jgi:hypothetical protein
MYSGQGVLTGENDMAASEGIAIDQLRGLAERSGLVLSPEELTALKPMFDHYATQIRVLFDIELDAEDPAVMYSPNWDPQS